MSPIICLHVWKDTSCALFNLSSLLLCLPGQSGLHCKHQIVQETNGCFCGVHFPADILFSFSNSRSRLKTVIHQTSLPHGLSACWRKALKREHGGNKSSSGPTWAASVKYTSDQRCWTIPRRNFPHCDYPSTQPMPYSAPTIDHNVLKGQKHVTDDRMLNMKFVFCFLGFFFCLFSTTSCLPFFLDVYHSLHMLWEDLYLKSANSHFWGSKQTTSIWLEENLFFFISEKPLKGYGHRYLNNR